MNAILPRPPARPLTLYSPDHYLDQQGSLFPYEPKHLSEIVWPSSHQLGLPDLDPFMQATTPIPEPLKIWGEQAHSIFHSGTYAFYTEDRRFRALWDNPAEFLKSGCLTAIEPNFSIRPRMPFPVAIFELFRKRWLTRLWQSWGIRMIVDMNVAPCYLALNLVGVPKTWRVFAMRVHKGEHDVLDVVHHLCCTYVQDDIHFVVYGGSDTRTQALCDQRGWQWFPETMHRQRRERTQQLRKKHEQALYSYSLNLS